VTAEPERFDEAVEWFAARFPITEQLSEALGDYAGERGWTIAGVAQLDVVNDVHASLTRAIESGIPFEEWRAEVRDKLTAAWGRPNSPRIETIFRNATSQSYNAGRWRQMHEPSVLALRPFGMFDGVDDSRQSPICRAWDGKILPLEEFAARDACPQLHHRCRSSIRSMRAAEAERRGVTTTPPTEQADEGFGREPTGPPWQPKQDTYPAALWSSYQDKAQDLRENSKRRIAKPTE
jgi:SPP1 gp7 family putative phage head morphogenesis protein